MNGKFEISRFMLGLIFFLMASSNAVAADKSLQSTDITYLGAFRLPSGVYGCSDTTYCSFEYASSLGIPGPIAFYPAHSGAPSGSLLIAGHVYHDEVAEVAIPTIVNSSTVSGLNTASIITNFTDITHGKISLGMLSSLGGGNGFPLAGLLYYPPTGALIGTAYAYYSQDSIQPQWTHFVTSPSLTTTTEFAGPYTVAGTNNGDMPVSYVNGYMTTIPDNSASGGTNWQTALGGTVLSGAEMNSIVGRTSLGPAAFVFDPADFSSNTPHYNLLYYNETNGLINGNGDWKSTSPYYNGTSQINGVVFPAGTSNILYFGDIGVGTTWTYKDATTCIDASGANPGQTACQAVIDGDTGRPTGSWDIHNPSYVFQIWAYNASDLAAVKAGTSYPWTPVPQLWQLSSPLINSQAFLGGVTYDETTQRIYITEGNADGSLPIVLVYQVNTGTTGTTNTTSTGSSDAAAPTVASFTLPSTATTLKVAISSFTATDNVGVTGYLVTQSSATPSASASGWSSSAPTSFTFSASGSQTAYAWAKDAAGNVSAGASASTVITLSSSSSAKKRKW